MKKRMMYLALSLLIVMSLTACVGKNSKKNQVKEVIQEFEIACNNKDVDAILSCIDPAIANPVKILINLSGTDVDSVIEEISNQMVSGLEEYDMDGAELLSNIEIEIKKVKCKKDTATAECKITTYITGVDLNAEGTFQLIKEEKKWYISSFELLEK